MPLAAKRVLYLVLAQIDPKRPLGRDVGFTVHAEDYARLCRIDRDSAYKQLRRAAIELMQQTIEIPKADLLPPLGRPGELTQLVTTGKITPDVPKTRMFNVTQWVDYTRQSGFIEVCPSRQMEPYIAHLSGDYTTQTLLSALRLTNKNTANIYQFLREAMSAPRHPKFIDVAIDDLKDRLSLYRWRYSQKIYRYPRYPDFKRDVINVALRTINQSTELVVSMSVVKKIGRRAHIIRFRYCESKQHDLQF